MKNQFSPMSLRFKMVANSRQIDQVIECLIEVYNEVCHKSWIYDLLLFLIYNNLGFSCFRSFFFQSIDENPFH